MSMKVFVTGGTGLLGSCIVNGLSAFAEVTSAVHSAPAQDGIATAHIALEDERSIRAALSGKGYTHVVHSAAIRNPEECLNNRERAYRINSVAVEYVADCCAANGIKLVYISTDYVFPGTAAPYREQCSPQPINVYGRSKLAGEYAAKAVEKHLIARIPALWGNDPDDAKSPLKGFIDKFKAGKPFPVENKLVRHYTLAADIAKALAFCIEKDMAGIIHLSSGESQTKADFARALGKQYGFDPSLIVNAGQSENEDARPLDSSLDTALYRSHDGPHIRGLSEVLSDMRQVL